MDMEKNEITVVEGILSLSIPYEELLIIQDGFEYKQMDFLQILGISNASSLFINITEPEECDVIEAVKILVGAKEYSLTGGCSFAINKNAQTGLETPPLYPSLKSFILSFISKFNTNKQSEKIKEISESTTEECDNLKTNEESAEQTNVENELLISEEKSEAMLEIQDIESEKEDIAKLAEEDENLIIEPEHEVSLKPPESSAETPDESSDNFGTTIESDEKSDKKSDKNGIVCSKSSSGSSINIVTIEKEFESIFNSSAPPSPEPHLSKESSSESESSFGSSSGIRIESVVSLFGKTSESIYDFSEDEILTEKERLERVRTKSQNRKRSTIQISPLPVKKMKKNDVPVFVREKETQKTPAEKTKDKILDESPSDLNSLHDETSSDKIFTSTTPQTSANLNSEEISAKTDTIVAQDSDKKSKKPAPTRKKYNKSSSKPEKFSKTPKPNKKSSNSISTIKKSEDRAKSSSKKADNLQKSSRSNYSSKTSHSSTLAHKKSSQPAEFNRASSKSSDDFQKSSKLSHSSKKSSKSAHVIKKSSKCAEAPIKIYITKSKHGVHSISPSKSINYAQASSKIPDSRKMASNSQSDKVSSKSSYNSNKTSKYEDSASKSSKSASCTTKVSVSHSATLKSADSAQISSKSADNCKIASKSDDVKASTSTSSTDILTQNPAKKVDERNEIRKESVVVQHFVNKDFEKSGGEKVRKKAEEVRGVKYTAENRSKSFINSMLFETPSKATNVKKNSAPPPKQLNIPKPNNVTVSISKISTPLTPSYKIPKRSPNLHSSSSCTNKDKFETLKKIPTQSSTTHATKTNTSAQSSQIREKNPIPPPKTQNLPPNKIPARVNLPAKTPAPSYNTGKVPKDVANSMKNRILALQLQEEGYNLEKCSQVVGALSEKKSTVPIPSFSPPQLPKNDFTRDPRLNNFVTPVSVPKLPSSPIINFIKQPLSLSHTQRDDKISKVETTTKAQNVRSSDPKSTIAEKNRKERSKERKQSNSKHRKKSEKERNRKSRSTSKHRDRKESSKVNNKKKIGDEINISELEMNLIVKGTNCLVSEVENENVFENISSNSAIIDETTTTLKSNLSLEKEITKSYCLLSPPYPVPKDKSPEEIKKKFVQAHKNIEDSLKKRKNSQIVETMEKDAEQCPPEKETLKVSENSQNVDKGTEIQHDSSKSIEDPQDRQELLKNPEESSEISAKIDKIHSNDINEIAKNIENKESDKTDSLIEPHEDEICQNPISSQALEICTDFLELPKDDGNNKELTAQLPEEIRKDPINSQPLEIYTDFLELPKDDENNKELTAQLPEEIRKDPINLQPLEIYTDFLELPKAIGSNDENIAKIPEEICKDPQTQIKSLENLETEKTEMSSKIVNYEGGEESDCVSLCGENLVFDNILSEPPTPVNHLSEEVYDLREAEAQNEAKTPPLAQNFNFELEPISPFNFDAFSPHSPSSQLLPHEKNKTIISPQETQISPFSQDVSFNEPFVTSFDKAVEKLSENGEKKTQKEAFVQTEKDEDFILEKEMGQEGEKNHKMSISELHALEKSKAQNLKEFEGSELNPTGFLSVPNCEEGELVGVRFKELADVYFYYQESGCLSDFKQYKTYLVWHDKKKLLSTEDKQTDVEQEREFSFATYESLKRKRIEKKEMKKRKKMCTSNLKRSGILEYVKK